MLSHRLKSLPGQRGQRGDTIIEVMVALAVIGLAVGISYTIANSSLLATREAQENSEATTIVQSQIEVLRTLSDAGNAPNIFQPGAPYCLNTTTNPYSLTPATPPANCNQGIYHIAVTYGGAPDDTFTVKASWDNVQGNGKDNISLDYRIHR